MLPFRLALAALLLGCGGVDVTKEEHWHTRYVRDACKRCPECCTTVTENGFIDEYGVERPLDWLPDDNDAGPVDTP